MKALKPAIASFLVTILFSASGVAFADDSDTAESTGIVAVVTEGLTADEADNTNSDVEDDSDVSDDSQLGEDATSDTDSGVAWSDCSTYNDADGNLVQKCKGEDADGNQVAISSVAPDKKNDSPKASQPKVSANSNSQRQTSRAVTSQSAWASSRPVAGTGVNLPVTFSKDSDKDSDEERVKLPWTCGVREATATSAKPGAKKCGRNSVATTTNVDTVANVASTALVIDDALSTASSRASFFTLVACAAFALVGAGSVVSVRRLNH